MNRQDLTYDRIKSGLQINPVLLPWVLMSMRGITLLVKFISTLFVAKYLGLNALGIYGLIAAAGILAPAVLGLGVMPSISRAAVKQPIGDTKNELVKYFIYLSIIYFIAAIGVAVYGVIKGEWLLASLILLVIFFEHINSECYQLMINLSRPLLADSLHFMRSASWLLIYMFAASVILSWRNIEALLIAWIIGSGLSAIIYVCVFARISSTPTILKTTLWNWLGLRSKQASGLYLNGVATTGASYSDRYIIGAFLNLELTGVYLFFWQIQSALSNLIYTGLIQVARPGLVKNFDQPQPDWQMVWNLLRNTSIAAVSFSIIALIVIALALPYLNMPLVSDYYSLFALVLMAFIFNVIAEAQVLVFYSQYKDRQVLLITLLVFAINISICLIGVPLWGLWGAAIAAIFSSLTRLCLQAWFISKYRLSKAIDE
jgi:O-antigen/teichoic acid export membrane protein